MRTLVFSMLAIVGMAACSSENDPIKDLEEAPVEIKLTAGVITTKTPIESDGTTGLPKADLAGIKIAQAPDGATADWTGVSTAASTATIKTTGDMEFTGEKLYYNANTTLNTYLIGYYPAATTSAAGSVSWTITGKEDIIVAKEVSGTKATPVGTLTFKHMLTQLRFQVKQETGAQWGNITEISIRKSDDTNLNTVASYTLASGDPSSLTWATPATGIMNIYEITGGTTYTDSPLSSKNIVLSTTNVLIGYIMVEPIAKGGYELFVKTTDNTTGIAVPIAINATGENVSAGSAYVVSLNFALKEITASAKIENWVTVEDGGSGEII